VIRLFRAYFDRLPDRSGLDYWTGRYRAGTSISAISASFAGSNEFKTTYGSLTNRAFVTLIYADVLKRDVDQSGVDYWTKQIDTKAKTRGQVMVGFSESTEYQRQAKPIVDLVEVTTGMLRRIPSADDTTLWQPLLAGGTARTALISSILSSAEYDARVP
jgi:hypothetical protein